MKMTRILAAAVLLLAQLPVVHAFDRVLPAPRVKTNGDVVLSDDLRLGSFLGGKYVATPRGIFMSDTSTSATNQNPIGLFRPNYNAFSNEDAGLVIQYGSSTAKSIRDQIPGALPQFDALQVVVDNAGPTNATGQVTAVAAYVRGRVQNKTGGNNGYPVALFGKATCEVNNCVAWSLNTVLNDSAIAAAESGATGRVIQNEIDFNVFNASTTVIGFNMLLNSLVKDGSGNPLVSSTFGINMQKNSGSAPWNVGFNTADGAAVTALNVGPAGVSGTNVASQLVSFNYLNGAGARGTVTLSAGASSFGTTLNLTGATGGFVAPNFYAPSGGILQFANATGGTPISAVFTDSNNKLNIGLNANGTQLWSSLTPSSAGTLNIGTPTTPFAVVAATTHYAGATVGVTCSGAPTSAFASSGGIVTHC